LGIGNWRLGPIPNPQSPIPNPQSPIPMNDFYCIRFLNKKLIINKNIILINIYNIEKEFELLEKKIKKKKIVIKMQ